MHYDHFKPKSYLKLIKKIRLFRRWTVSFNKRNIFGANHVKFRRKLCQILAQNCLCWISAHWSVWGVQRSVWIFSSLVCEQCINDKGEDLEFYAGNDECSTVFFHEIVLYFRRITWQSSVITPVVLGGWTGPVPPHIAISNKYIPWYHHGQL